ncbi:hypothetical protein FQ187_25750 [Pseudomonas sp. ANT_J28]|nr:hypothetical protein FQ187_25750 [Pseudomonas sp. ANT_J28]
MKKSGLISTEEKHAPEIEILAFSRGFQTRISRSRVQKRCFYPSVLEHFGQTDFFNRIDPKRTFFRYNTLINSPRAPFSLIGSIPMRLLGTRFRCLLPFKICLNQ